MQCKIWGRFCARLVQASKDIGCLIIKCKQTEFHCHKSNMHLWLGCGASDPYSCVCKPKKQMSLPSIFWNAKIPFAVYGKLDGASGNRCRMNDLTSVDLEVQARTRMAILMSAAPHSDKNALTRFSKCEPSFVCASSDNTAMLSVIDQWFRYFQTVTFIWLNATVKSRNKINCTL